MRRKILYLILAIFLLLMIAQIAYNAYQKRISALHTSYKSRLLELENKLNEKPKEIVRYVYKDRKVKEIPANCQECFNQLKIKKEIKTDYFSYYDDNILDDKPGKIILKDRFFKEIECPKSLPRKRNKEIFLGTSLNSYRLDFGYYPFSFNFKSWQIRVGVRASLENPHSYFEPRASVFLGIYLDF